MMISPAVESTCVTAAAYTKENSTRMKSWRYFEAMVGFTQPFFITP